jgi:hypothetical protein
VRLVSCVFGLGVVAAFGLAEAQSNPPTPEQVVRDFFKAEEEGRWIDAARSLDLARFEPVRRSVIQSARSVTSRRTTTAQQLMESDPAMPLAVAEYHVKRMNETFRAFDFFTRIRTRSLG